MSTQTIPIPMPAAESVSIYATAYPGSNPRFTLGSLVAMLPGIALLFGIGILGKFLQNGAGYLDTRFGIHILHIGGLSLLLVAVELVLSLSVMTMLGRIFRLSPKLTSLLAIGSSICGVTAIMAARGAIDPDEEDTST